MREGPVFRGRRFYSLDDFAVLEAAKRDPDGLVAGNEPVTIDEAQRCPELFIAVKRAVDRKQRPGQFVLSGSANLTLLNSVTESLAGRAIYLKLTPFTRRETRGGVKRKPFLASLIECRRSLPEKRYNRVSGFSATNKRIWSEIFVNDSGIASHLTGVNNLSAGAEARLHRLKAMGSACD